MAVARERALAMCSPSRLDAVHTRLRAMEAPACGPRTLHRAFIRARNKAVTVTERAVIRCVITESPRIAPAHKALLGVIAKAAKLVTAGTLAHDCAVTYESELAAIDADLTAAANGTETTSTTTTTSVPGAPTTTTTTLAACATITLEVDKGDCTGVTSIPRGLVRCGANCGVQTFTVPAFGTLQLEGTPAPGDVGVTFGDDCDDDGTVPLGDASPPDCSLSCDCSSGS